MLGKDPDATATCTVISGNDPLTGRMDMVVQVTSCPVTVHDQSVPAAATGTSPPGIVIATVVGPLVGPEPPFATLNT